MCANKDINRYAQEFDVWCQYYDPAQVELKTLLDICNLNGKIVLEIGCGTGRMTFQIAPLVHKCVGIDIDEKLITFCKKRLNKYEFNNLEFSVGDGEKLGFQDESFDIVLFTWSLSCINNKYCAVQESYRVLKPGGKAVLIEPAPGSDYSKVVTDFLPKDYPRINTKEDYEKPLIQVFGEIKKIIPPFKAPYVFPSVKEAYDVFKFALVDWHKVEMTKKYEEMLLNRIRPYQRGKNVVINEVITYYMCEKSR